MKLVALGRLGEGILSSSLMVASWTDEPPSFYPSYSSDCLTGDKLDGDLFINLIAFDIALRFSREHGVWSFTHAGGILMGVLARCECSF